MANTRQPIQLIQLKGKKHLTKKEIQDRINSEVKAPTSTNPKPPKYLKKELKKQFKEIANQLIELDIYSDLDADSLARYIIALDLYIRITGEIEAIKDLNSEDNIQLMIKLSSIQDKYFKQCRLSASDMGLTITSRCRLVIPKPPEPKRNKFDKFEL